MVDISIGEFYQSIFKRDIQNVIKRILRDIVRESGFGEKQLFELYDHAMETKRPSRRIFSVLDNVFTKGYEQTDITGLSMFILYLKIIEKSTNFQTQYQNNIRAGVVHMTRIRNQLEHTVVLSRTLFEQHIKDLTSLAARFSIYLDKTRKTYLNDVESILEKAFHDIERQIAIRNGLYLRYYCYNITENDGQFELVDSSKTSISCKQEDKAQSFEPAEPKVAEDIVGQYEYLGSIPQNCSKHKERQDKKDEREIKMSNNNENEQQSVSEQQRSISVERHIANSKQMHEMPERKTTKKRFIKCLKKKFESSKCRGKPDDNFVVTSKKMPESNRDVVEYTHFEVDDKHCKLQNEQQRNVSTERNIVDSKQVPEMSKSRTTAKRFTKKIMKKFESSKFSGKSGGDLAVTRHKMPDTLRDVVEHTRNEVAEKHCELQNEEMTQCNTAWNLEQRSNVDTAMQHTECICPDKEDMLSLNDLSLEGSQMFEEVMKHQSKHIVGFKMASIHAHFTPGYRRWAKRIKTGYLLYVLFVGKHQEPQSHDIFKFMYHLKILIGTQKKKPIGNCILPALLVSEVPLRPDYIAFKMKRAVARARKREKPYDIVFLYCTEDKGKAELYFRLTKEKLQSHISHLKLELFENLQKPGEEVLSAFLNASIQSHMTVIVFTRSMADSECDLLQLNMVIANSLVDGYYPENHMILIAEVNCTISDFLLPLECIREDDLVKGQKMPESFIKMCKDCK